jgi:hypothetical protein
VDESSIKSLANKEVMEWFDINSLTIYLNSTLPKSIQKYALFHAIWEVLLNLTGQYFNHEGFQGFSYLLFSTLKDNNLGDLLCE